MAVVEAGAEKDAEEWYPLAHPEWTMPAGWVTLLVALSLAVCVVAGVLA